ncbi:hypothetical protein Pyn_15378 [Prunus yedoensis var. nudiflora]|uniref:Uncharacterized protein n=1 Tax=Prunus yedoensis var. nudiflora TaxID=2094558 RepID=A0A314ZZK1_PRUYE|nr:hypothetical protein Pyn_15378 [Prunus yedoensis var. nudiflora]
MSITTTAAATGREYGRERVEQNPNNSHLDLAPLWDKTARIKSLREIPTVDHSRPCTLHLLFASDYLTGMKRVSLSQIKTEEMAMES